MCGIVGYLGIKEKKEILLDGLQELEYRGYDSAGIAVRITSYNVCYTKLLRNIFYLSH